MYGMLQLAVPNWALQTYVVSITRIFFKNEKKKFPTAQWNGTSEGA
jgi:hypothetical protein